MDQGKRGDNEHLVVSGQVVGGGNILKTCDSNSLELISSNMLVNSFMNRWNQRPHQRYPTYPPCVYLISWENRFDNMGMSRSCSPTWSNTLHGICGHIPAPALPIRCHKDRRDKSSNIGNLDRVIACRCRRQRRRYQWPSP
jgi:hypothetical protein